jgi:hypothetical protein
LRTNNRPKFAHDLPSGCLLIQLRGGGEEGDGEAGEEAEEELRRLVIRRVECLCSVAPYHVGHLHPLRHVLEQQRARVVANATHR